MLYIQESSICSLGGCVYCCFAVGCMHAFVKEETVGVLMGLQRGL